MAKKSVVVIEESNGTAKRKRSCCCSCCIIILIVSLVLTIGAGVAGYFIGDKYSREYLDMPLKDVLGVVSGFYGAKEKDIVKKPYSSADTTAFYNGLKKHLFLNEDVELNSGTLMEFVQSATNTTRDGEPDETDTNIMTKITEYLGSLLKRENIDLEYLKEYSDENKQNYLLNITDKGLAAFVNDILFLMIESGGLLKDMDLSDYGISNDKIKDILALNQMIISKPTYKDVQNNDVPYAALTMTVSLKVEKALDIGIDYAIENTAAIERFAWAGGTVKVLKNILLPKCLYLSVTLPLNAPDAEVGIKINNMNSKKQADTIKLINGIMNMSEPEEPFDLSAMLKETLAGDGVKEIFDMIGELIDLDSDDIENGKLPLDMYKIIADMINNSGADISDPVKPEEIIYTLQALLTSSMEGQLLKANVRAAVFNRWATLNADGTEIFILDTKYDGNGKPESYTYVTFIGGTASAKMTVQASAVTLIDYSKAFVEELETKYMLKLADDKGDPLEFSEVVSLFTGMGSSGLNIMDLFDGAGLKDAVDDDINDLKVVITDRMLGAIVNEMLEDIAGDLDFDVNLEAVSIIKKSGHTLAMLAVSVDVSLLLGNLESDDSMISLIENLLPEELMLTITIDITAAEDLNGGDKFKTEFEFNDYQKTEAVMNFLGKLAPQMDTNELTDKIATPLEENLNGMTEMMPGIEFKQSAIMFSDLFTMLYEFAFKDVEFDDVKDENNPNGGYDSNAEALKDILSGIYEEITVNVNTEGGYDGFVDEVKEKYYISADTTPQAGQTRFDALLNIMTSGSGFDANNFYLKPKAGDPAGTKYLLYDSAAASALKPVMTEAQLGALLKEKTGSDIDVEGLELVRLEIDTDLLRLVFKLTMDELLGDDLKFIAVNEIYITANIDLSTEFDNNGTKYYHTDIVVNRMTDMQQSNFMKLIKQMAGNSDTLDFDKTAMDIGKVMYEQLLSISDSLGSKNGVPSYEFTNNGLEFMGFWDFLAIALETDSDPETVKAAIQGLYEKDGASSAYNYDSDAIVMNNPGSFNPTEIAAWAIPGTKTIADDKIAAFLQYTLNLNGENINVEQAVALAGGDNSDEAKAVAAWLNDFGVGAFELESRAEDFLLITFELSMDQFSTTRNDSSSASASFEPDKVYASVLLTYDANGDFIVYQNGATQWIRVNEMTIAAQDTLFDMLGIDLTGGGVLDITQNCLNILSSFEGSQINVTAGSGIGQLSFTNYNI